jgi:hypothetical protein
VSSPDGKDRRKGPRQPVADSFSLGMMLPKKGPQRLRIFDLSKEGLGIEVDVDADDPDPMTLAKGDQIECHLYLNQSLYVPLQAEVAWLDNQSPRRAGLSLIPKDSKGWKGYSAFLTALEELEEVGVIGS